MPFCFYTRPLAGGQKFTGQPEVQGTRSSADSIAAIAERSGAPIPQVEAVIKAMSEYVIEETMNGWRIAPLLGYIGFQGTCGGSHELPNFYPTFDSLAVDIRMSLGKAGDLLAREHFSPKTVAHRPAVTPEIVRVTNMHTGEENTYTPGKPIQVELADSRGKLDTNQTTQGIFFKSPTGVLTRVTDYSYCRGTIIGCTAPAGISGPQDLCVTLSLYGTVRTGTYSKTLTLEPSEEAPAKSNGRGKGGGKDMALIG